jgi:hypothetical protein
MTIEDLRKYLVDNSPFKFKGDAKELFTFFIDTFSIDNGQRVSYELSKTGDNFTFNDGGLIPVFQNIKIKQSDTDENTVIINYDPQRLKDDFYRNKDAEDGYFILEPFQQNK